MVGFLVVSENFNYTAFNKPRGAGTMTMKRHIYFDGALHQTDFPARAGYAFKATQPFGRGTRTTFDVATSAANAANGIGIHKSNSGPDAVIVSGKLIDGWIVSSRQDSFVMPEDEYRSLVLKAETDAAEAAAWHEAEEERLSWLRAHVQSVEVSKAIYDKASQWLIANGCPPPYANEDEFNENPLDYRLPQFACDVPMLSPTMTFNLYNVESALVERFKTAAEKLRIDALYAI